MQSCNRLIGSSLAKDSKDDINEGHGSFGWSIGFL